MGKGLLVLKIAQEYQNRGLTEDELVEAGFNGLRKAAKKYGIKDFINLIHAVKSGFDNPSCRLSKIRRSNGKQSPPSN